MHGYAWAFPTGNFLFPQRLCGDNAVNVAIRARVLDAMVEVLPHNADPQEDCRTCDPSGGCATPHDCMLELCERLLAVIEREGHISL